MQLSNKQDPTSWNPEPDSGSINVGSRRLARWLVRHPKIDYYLLIAPLNFFGRIRTGWLAFRNPELYWDGVQIRDAVRMDKRCFVTPDRELGHIVHVLPYKDGAMIQRFLECR